MNTNAKNDKNAISFYECLFDEHNNPIKRDKVSYPYSYDGHVIWRCGPNELANSTVYSDRLYEQDPATYDALSKKHFGNVGQIFSNRKPKQIEAFLIEFLKDPTLELIFIMEYCNQSSGYPYWRFEVKRNKQKTINE